MQLSMPYQATGIGIVMALIYHSLLNETPASELLLQQMQAPAAWDSSCHFDGNYHDLQLQLPQQQLQLQECLQPLPQLPHMQAHGLEAPPFPQTSNEQSKQQQELATGLPPGFMPVEHGSTTPQGPYIPWPTPADPRPRKRRATYAMIGAAAIRAAIIGTAWATSAAGDIWSSGSPQQVGCDMLHRCAVERSQTNESASSCRTAWALLLCYSSCICLNANP